MGLLDNPNALMGMGLLAAASDPDANPAEIMMKMQKMQQDAAYRRALMQDMRADQALKWRKQQQAEQSLQQFQDAIGPAVSEQEMMGPVRGGERRQQIKEFMPGGLLAQANQRGDVHGAGLLQMALADGNAQPFATHHGNRLAQRDRIDLEALEQYNREGLEDIKQDNRYAIEDYKADLKQQAGRDYNTQVREYHMPNGSKRNVIVDPRRAPFIFELDGQTPATGGTLMDVPTQTRDMTVSQGLLTGGDAPSVTPAVNPKALSTEQVQKATGPAARIQEALSNAFGWMVPGTIFGETGDAIAAVERFKNAARETLVVGDRHAVWDQAEALKLLPDTDAWMKDPDQAARDFANFHDWVVSKEGGIEAEIKRPDITPMRRLALADTLSRLRLLKKKMNIGDAPITEGAGIDQSAVEAELRRRGLK